MYVVDKSANKKEERMAIALAAEVGIQSINKMEERLLADTEENFDPEVLKEISSRVVGKLRRRITSKDDIENALMLENLERRFRLTALRAERGELYHLRATQKISNETLQKLLNDLDLMEALLVEREG
jgi:CPA1 family monovalent cation:H+ antiporter